MSGYSDVPANEALGSTGLLLNIAAVIAFAVGLAGIGVASVTFIAGSLSVAVLIFLASVVCLFLDGRRAEDHPAVVPAAVTH